MTKYPMVILTLCAALGFYFKSNEIILSILIPIMIVYFIIDIKKSNPSWKDTIKVLISNIIQLSVLIGILYFIFY